MSEILLTQEVGSLAKPDWRVEAIAHAQLTDGHISEALVWAGRLGLDGAETQETLEWTRQQLADQQTVGTAKNAVRNLAARFAVRLQEQAGLDIVYDGEQDRSEMYQHAIERTNGFDWRGRVRAFDNKSYKKAACVGEPSIDEPWHTEEVKRLKDLTNRQIKVPITGAYTLGKWSFDEHYQDVNKLVLSIARNAIRPNIEALLAQGVEWIQIDEPAATTSPEEVPLFIKSFNESVRGLIGKFSVHICFSNYSLLFPHIEEIENCSQFSLEFANRDSHQAGVDAVDRPAYEILGDFNSHLPDVAIGLGVTSVHDDLIEPASLVKDRILRAVDLLDDPAKVYPSPDCGLRTRSWDIAYRKLAATTEGAQLAKEQLK